MRDHVIPRSFFVPPLPKNIYTLPAHYDCQKDEGEELLRFLTVNMTEHSPTATELQQTTVKRFVQRNPNFVSNIVQAIEESEQLAGRYPADYSAVRVDPRVWSTLFKIARGLYWRERGHLLCPDAKFGALNWAPLPPRFEPEQRAGSLKKSLSYIGVFESWYYIPEDNVEESVI